MAQTSRAWIELDRDALGHNVRLLRERLPEGCRLAAVVKANAYGHGAVPVARALEERGVEHFCVATVDEGAALREHGIRGTILILGYTAPARYPELVRYDLTQTAADYDHARALDRCGVPLRVQLAVDTGMHRLGEPWDRTDRIAEMLRMPNLRVSGVYTHLCADDRPDPASVAFTGTQAARFQSLLGRLRERGLTPAAHLLGSYGLLHTPQYGGCLARVGIALYGVLSSRADRDRCSLPLRPVLSLKAGIALVRTVPAGDSVGYGLEGRADRDRRIAVVTIGYADGLPRNLSHGHGKILVHGRYAPIVGRICMDQMMVDVSDIPEAAPGDAAVLIGTDGSREITAYDLAEESGTITNELLSRLGTRLDRITVP